MSLHTNLSKNDKSKTLSKASGVVRKPLTKGGNSIIPLLIISIFLFVSIAGSLGIFKQPIQSLNNYLFVEEVSGVVSVDNGAYLLDEEDQVFSGSILASQVGSFIELDNNQLISIRISEESSVIFSEAMSSSLRFEHLDGIVSYEIKDSNAELSIINGDDAISMDTESKLFVGDFDIETVYYVSEGKALVNDEVLGEGEALLINIDGEKIIDFNVEDYLPNTTNSIYE